MRRRRHERMLRSEIERRIERQYAINLKGFERFDAFSR